MKTYAPVTRIAAVMFAKPMELVKSLVGSMVRNALLSVLLILTAPLVANAFFSKILAIVNAKMWS